MKVVNPYWKWKVKSVKVNIIDNLLCVRYRRGYRNADSHNPKEYKFKYRKIPTESNINIISQIPTLTGINTK